MKNFNWACEITIEADDEEKGAYICDLIEEDIKATIEWAKEERPEVKITMEW